MRSKLVQGKPERRRRGLGLALLVLLVALALPAAAVTCRHVPLQALGASLWLVPAPASESDADNRGHSSHLLLARDGPRLWVVGSGPTPAFGQRLRCTALARLGRAPTDLIVPWAKAELALGSRGLGRVRIWAHAQVAAAMAEQCGHCVERLGQRLGAAAPDLGPDPVGLPRLLVHGQAGRLGPFDWWVLPRAEGRVVTVLRHRASGVMAAHGLLWGDGPPDARDADLALLTQALRHLAELGAPAARWVGDSGPLLDAQQVADQARYLQALQATARAAVESGQTGVEAPALAGPEAASGHPRHALNWQRAWRQAEDTWLRGER